ncbi:MAG: flavodoxin family protein [Pedobacter sp.]|nr:MAG: flavodoxin family protein [Pedobacter sp.]
MDKTKILIIFSHPNSNTSVVNKRWQEELNKYPEKYVIHDLYKTYPDEKIDVEAEQKLIEQYDKIVFQFPMYWFSSPPLLKKWLDEVLIYGWAFGSKSGYKVAGKKIALAISLGADEEDYQANGKYKYQLAELLRPFELTFEYVKAIYQPHFSEFGADELSSEGSIEQSVSRYISYLERL